MSGISLGLIAFFMFLAIESSFPNSFNGLSNNIINGASFKMKVSYTTVLSPFDYWLW